MLDICIIGGGAAGLAAAISAARCQPSASIGILEKKEAVGKKLLATGNGRCNLSNSVCSRAAETLAFFSSLGIQTREEREGRLYPYSMQAKDVVYALTAAARRLGVVICTERPVTGLERAGSGFAIRLADSGQQTDGRRRDVRRHSGQQAAHRLTAAKVLLATGGKAGPQFGTTGDGFGLARALGHQVTALAPALTGLEVNPDLRPLKGLRAQAAVWLEKDGVESACERGEVQFNADSISGICIMNLSRLVRLEPGESFAAGFGRYTLRIDFVPDMTLQETKTLLTVRRQVMRDAPEAVPAEELLLSLVPGELRRVLAAQAGIDPRSPLPADGRLDTLAALLKGWRLPLKGVKGWRAAQCTAGGVALTEVDMDTMESRLVKNLYFAGEILDIDGPCGGFNLQNAWETGIRAGKAMARSAGRS